MSDVLDQSEVDALLAAVDTSPASSAAGRRRRSSRPAGTSTADVQVYDFKRPERVSKDQMRALEALHEGFGRNFGAALSGYLRTIIEVSASPTSSSSPTASSSTRCRTRPASTCSRPSSSTGSCVWRSAR